MVINFVFFLATMLNEKLTKKNRHIILTHLRIQQFQTHVEVKKKTYGAMKYIIYKSVLA
jgi:hypothetical protein